MLNNIQYLRGIAALLVVAYHSSRSSITFGFDASVGSTLQTYGAFGVDIFFVISGFIMTYTQSEKPKATLDFLRNRFYRIVPLYWLHLAAYITVILLFPATVAAEGHLFDLEHLLLSFLFVSQVFLDTYPSVQVGWTLELEMIFYAIFGLSLLLENRKYQILALSIAISATSAWKPIMLEFLLGVIIGLIYINRSNHRLQHLQHFGGLFFLSGIALILTYPVIFDDGTHRVLAWGIPSFFIVLGAIFLPAGHSPTLLKLGDMSYSLYLSHWFITPAFYLVADTLIPDSGASPGFLTELLVLMCIMICIVVGFATYTLVEAPLTRLKPQVAISGSR